MKKRHLFQLLVLLMVLFLLTGCREPAASGWETNEHGTVYRDETGKPVTGWQEIGGTRYHFADNGILTTGWLETAEGRYYLDENGVAVSGWLQLDGIMHYFAENGAAVTGWVTSRGMKYYLTENGPLTGWQEIEGKRYYFQEGGSLLTGWAELSGERYYFSEEGQVLTGWQEIDGQRYHFSEDGAMTVGWYRENGSEYYFDSLGIMAAGTVEIDGSLRYFTGTGIHIPLVNPWNPLPEGFTTELVYIEDGYQMDVLCSEALLRMLADCRAAGHNPKLVSGYRTQDVQEYLFDVKVQFYLDLDYSLEDAEVEAAKSIAIPGTSEHQIGLAVDILDAKYTVMDDSQADTATQKWLMEHCHEYGFILRYPKGTTDITGIIYEPWHYRYVGVEIAGEITQRGITLEEYLNAVATD